MKPSWPEFPPTTTTTTTTEAATEAETDVDKEAIDYEEQHLQDAALWEEVQAKYDGWLAEKGVPDEQRADMVGRGELLVAFAKEELKIFM